MARPLAFFALLAPLAPLALPACSDDPSPLVGVWQVTAHTHNPTACDAPGPAVTEPAFVRFTAQHLLGVDYVERLDCTSATACEDSGGLFGELYAEPIDGGLRSSVYVASGDQTRCTLAASRGDAVLAADGSLSLDRRRFEGRDLVGVACTADSAEQMLASLPCAELDQLTATRVP